MTCSKRPLIALKLTKTKDGHKADSAILTRYFFDRKAHHSTVLCLNGLNRIDLADLNAFCCLIFLLSNDCGDGNDRHPLQQRHTIVRTILRSPTLESQYDRSNGTRADANLFAAIKRQSSHRCSAIVKSEYGYCGVGMVEKLRDRKIAAALAFAGAVSPIGAGLHKFYVGQPLWGIFYLLLSMTPLPRVASAIEGIWYLSQNADEFDLKFNDGVTSTATIVSRADVVDSDQIGAVADAVRHLNQLRADGLLSEYEFEQKRRKLLDRIA